MDFFFSPFFASPPAETSAELESEIKQIPVDYEDGSGGGSGCVVA
jgi:hypothetical protein